jgi:hypothetical protein
LANSISIERESDLSKGSPIVPVRFPGGLIHYLDETIFRVNLSRKKEPYDRGSFIRAAVEEKLAHYERSNKKKPARSSATRPATRSSTGPVDRRPNFGP